MYVVNEVEIEQIISRKQKEFRQDAERCKDRKLKDVTVFDLADFGISILEEIRSKIKERRQEA